MKTVVMTQGAYGYKPEGSRLIHTKTAADGPFELPDAEADRLVVELEVARYADPTSAPHFVERPEYNVDMNANNLKALMKAVGLPTKTAMKKVDIVAALDEYYDALEDDADPQDGDEDDPDGGDGDESEGSEDDGDDDPEDDGEGPPETGAADPVL